MTIRHESDTVSGTCVYCDECDTRGPWTAYDNTEDTFDCAEQSGWDIGDSGDYCPACVKAGKNVAHSEPEMP